MVLVGVGNAYRGDDAVGRRVARRIRDDGLTDVIVREESGEGTELMEVWKDAEAVILVDAVQSGDVPGSIHRFDAQAQRIPAKFFHYSTHAFSVAEAVELARALDQLPRRLILYGVEGKDFAAGEGLSREVADALEELISRVRQEIQAIRADFRAGKESHA